MSFVGSSEFTPLGRDQPGSLFRKRTAIGGQYRCFVDRAGRRAAFVSHVALRDMWTAADLAWPNETIGLLLGRPLRDQLGTYALIEQAIPAQRSEASREPGSARISAAGWRALRGRAEQLAPVLEPMGWFHSHPHSPPRFSSVDLDEQATWPRGHHVGIVASLLAEAGVGVYLGPDAEQLHLVRRDAMSALELGANYRPAEAPRRPRPTARHDDSAGRPRPWLRVAGLLGILFLIAVLIEDDGGHPHHPAAHHAAARPTRLSPTPMFSPQLERGR